MSEQRVQDSMRSLTLEEKVGQLFTFYNYDPLYSAFAETAIRDWKVGGMFLDMKSLADPSQVQRLTSAMQKAAVDRDSDGGRESGIPLFVSADFVAGAGCKLSQGGATHFPKNKAIGACGNEKLAYESGRITALESLAMGVNFNYSPVVDINNNPKNPVIGTHSFGEQSDLVSRMGAAVIKGYQKHGMIATAKHFPGHGDTQVDSHLALPVLAFDRARLDGFELTPFRHAIAAGVDAVMVGHIAVPALDPSGLPASLSQKITTGLLREALGFQGLIVTDGMSMKGVTSLYTQADACVMALQAGADVLLVDAATIAEGQEMVARVLAAVRNGELEEIRIDASVERILQMKEKYRITVERIVNAEYELEELNMLNMPAHEHISLELARGAMQEMNGIAALLQAKTADSSRWTLLCDKQLTSFAEQIRGEEFIEAHYQLESYDALHTDLPLGHPLNPWAKAASLGSYRLLLALTHNKPMNPDMLEQLNEYAGARPGQVALIHFGSQYDIEHLPNVPALLLYDRAPSLQTVAAEYIKTILTGGYRR